MPNLTFDAQADGATLVAAPAAQCFIRVIGGEFTSAAGIVTASLLSDETVIWQTKEVGATPFGASMNLDRERTVDCAPGEPLNLGLSGGALSGNIEYAIFGMENQQLFVS